MALPEKLVNVEPMTDEPAVLKLLAGNSERSESRLSIDDNDAYITVNNYGREWGPFLGSDHYRVDIHLARKFISEGYLQNARNGEHNDLVLSDRGSDYYYRLGR